MSISGQLTPGRPRLRQKPRMNRSPTFGTLNARRALCLCRQSPPLRGCHQRVHTNDWVCAQEKNYRRIDPGVGFRNLWRSSGVPTILSTGGTLGAGASPMTDSCVECCVAALHLQTAPLLWTSRWLGFAQLVPSKQPSVTCQTSLREQTYAPTCWEDSQSRTCQFRPKFTTSWGGE